MTEWLAESLELGPGMRAPDLGCGRALSPVFLRREFGGQARADDLRSGFQRVLTWKDGDDN